MRLQLDATLAQHAAQHEANTLRAALRAYELRYPRAFGSKTHDTRGDASLPDQPLFVDRGAMETLFRLKQATAPIQSTERYMPPSSGGSPADRELRRLLHAVHTWRWLDPRHLQHARHLVERVEVLRAHVSPRQERVEVEVTHHPPLHRRLLSGEGVGRGRAARGSGGRHG